MTRRQLREAFKAGYKAAKRAMNEAFSSATLDPYKKSTGSDADFYKTVLNFQEVIDNMADYLRTNFKDEGKMIKPGDDLQAICQNWLQSGGEDLIHMPSYMTSAPPWNPNGPSRDISYFRLKKFYVCNSLAKAFDRAYHKVFTSDASGRTMSTRVCPFCKTGDIANIFCDILYR